MSNEYTYSSYPDYPNLALSEFPDYPNTLQISLDFLPCQTVIKYFGLTELPFIRTYVHVRVRIIGVVYFI